MESHWKRLVSPKMAHPFCNGSVEKSSVMVLARDVWQRNEIPRTMRESLHFVICDSPRKPARFDQNQTAAPPNRINAHVPGSGTAETASMSSTPLCTSIRT